MITKEEILKRIEMLEQDKEKLLSNYNAVLGAIQDCNYWIQKLTEEDSEN